MSRSDRGDRERWHGEAVTDEGAPPKAFPSGGRWPEGPDEGAMVERFFVFFKFFGLQKFCPAPHITPRPGGAPPPFPGVAAPRGEGFFWGGAPSSAPVCALGHLPPRGKAIVVGRRNEVSHKVLCQAFFQESGKTLSSRDWDESVWFASWCHPISERPGRSLWTPCCGGGAAPVSRPAGGAVFGRVRLRGVLSTWGRSPWDLSLSGGIPVTHAPSWR